jgi:hypothetical protein
MKTKILLLVVILGALLTNGSSCIQEDFLVPVNIPITGCYDINAGTNLNYSGSTTIFLKDEIPSSLSGDLASARYYDIRVTAHGSYAGNVVGTAYINGIPLFNYGSGANATSPASWSVFTTPQSLLGSSRYITSQAAGINELLRILSVFPTNPNLTVTISSSGSLSGQSPVPSGLSVCLEILTQADVKVSK